ncbi:MAG: IS66 family insertion sequence element accessory protein TnpB [Paracoccus sp. (in: a-proteobacteria)]
MRDRSSINGRQKAVRTKLPTDRAILAQVRIEDAPIGSAPLQDRHPRLTSVASGAQVHGAVSNLVLPADYPIENLIQLVRYGKARHADGRCAIPRFHQSNGRGVEMISPAGNFRIYLATVPVDFRKGMDGLAAIVQSEFDLDPFSGAIFVFRAKRSDRLKIVVRRHRTGACLQADRGGGLHLAEDQRRHGFHHAVAV